MTKVAEHAGRLAVGFVDPLDSRLVEEKFGNFVGRLGRRLGGEDFEMGTGRSKLLLVLGSTPIILLEMGLKRGAG